MVQPGQGPSSDAFYLGGGGGRTAVLNGGKAPKRRKTQRACDYCRDHKLRCDFENAARGLDGGKVCKHCADFGIECLVTAPPSTRPRSSAIGSSSTESPSASSSRLNVPSREAEASWLRLDDQALSDPRYGGESSLSALVSHFITLVTTRREQAARKVDFTQDADSAQPTGMDNFLLIPQIRYPAPLDGSEADLDTAQIGSDTMRMLIDRYLTYIQPVNCVLTQKEVWAAFDLSKPSQPIASLPHVAMSILCLAAMYRSTPRDARDTLLFHQRHRRMPIFRSSVETVQSMAVLSQSIEVMAPDTNDAAGMSLNMLGLAIRMAQDLGMHRDLSRLGVAPTRGRCFARIWSALVIQDRWYSLCYGQPQLIHLEDCDAALPSPYEDDQDPNLASASTPQPFRAHVVHYELAVLMGRIHKLAFGPRGLQATSFGDVRQILREIDIWDSRLPPSLCFATQTASIPTPYIEAGWLFSMRVTIEFLVYRIALNIPVDILPLDRTDMWRRLVRKSSEALEWLSSSDGLHCLDSYSITLYFLVQCSVVQYYGACQGGSLHSLRVARQSMQNHGSVATAATTKSQIYDPYGPYEHQRHSFKHGELSAGQTEIRTGSNRKEKKAELPAGSGGDSDSTTSNANNSDTPRLLRLRVKISALLNLLLEMAEQRRAIVLMRRDSSVEEGANAAKRRQPGGGLMKDVKLTMPPHPSHHPELGPSTEYRYGQMNGMPRATTDGTGYENPANVNVYAVQSVPCEGGAFPQEGANGNGMDRSAQGMLRSSMSYAQNPGMADQADFSSSRGQNGMMSARVATPLEGMGVASTASMAAHSMDNVPPRRIEDLDLMTLQRWADALLRDPAVPPDVQQMNPVRTRAI